MTSATNSNSTATQYYNTNNSYRVTTPSTATSISGWNTLGWRVNTTATTANTALGGVSTSSVKDFYAVYDRDVTFYSGVSKATTNSVKQYYNTNGGFAVTPPTASVTGLSNYGWTALGWRNDTTASTAETISGEINCSTTFYAVYSRTITFNGGSSSTVIQYYNTNDAITNVTAPALSDKTDWTKEGYRDDSSAGDNEKSAGDSLSIAYNLKPTYYAVYSRKITFNSGENSATVNNNVTQYYNVNGSYNATTPTPAAISGWTALGWRNDTTAGAKEYDSNATITASSATYYAVYSRTVTFVSGYNQATSNGGVTRYYNSANKYAVTAPTATAISGWTHKGWRADTTATTADSSYASSNNATYYAVYERTITFYSGSSKATTSTPKQYYNSYNNITSVTAPAITAISGLTTLGYRDDTTAGSKEKSVGDSISIAYNSTPTYYAVYSRDAVFKSGVSCGTSTNATQYYNTNGAYLATAPSDIADVSGWSEVAWRANTNAVSDTANISKGASTTSSATTFYAIYQRTVTFKSGLNTSMTTDGSGTQYLNCSSNKVSSVTAPSALTSIHDSWDALGYRNDNSRSSAHVSLGGAASPPYDESSEYYGVYERYYGYRYDANGGSGSMDTTYTWCGYNTSRSNNAWCNSVTLTANKFTAPSCKKFGSWNTAQGGGGTSYSNAGTIDGFEPAYNASYSKTLYARWVQDSVVVEFDVCGGTWDSASEGGMASNCPPLTLPTSYPSKTGYTFKGWSSTSCSGSPNHLAGSQISASVMLYAIYQPITYNIKYNAGTGADLSTVSLPTSGTYGSNVSIPNPGIDLTVQNVKIYFYAKDNASVGTSYTNATRQFAGWTSSSSAGLMSGAMAGSASWSGGATKATTFKNLRSSSGTVTLTATTTYSAITFPSVSYTGSNISGAQGVSCDWYPNWSSSSGCYGSSFSPGQIAVPKTTTYYACCE